MKLTCPSCKTSYAVRVRITKGEMVCGKCGYIGKIENKDREK